MKNIKDILKKDLKKKIIKSIKLIIILVIVGVVISVVQNYYANEKGILRKYQKEIKDVINLEGNKSVIKIIKEDMNLDGVQDYVVLLAEKKYEETKNIFSYFLLNDNLEMYNNVSVEYINGNDFEKNRYDTLKSYSTDMEMKLVASVDEKYILLNDKSNGNVAVLRVNEEKVENVLASSFTELNGYTIDASFDDTGKVVNVKLDNYGSDYLEKKDEDFTLDYTSDFGVNSDNYRITYMANKYSNFNLYFDENNVLILECTQYILYSNINFLERNQGDIKVNFKLKDDKTAFEFLNVKVEK